MGTGIGHSTRDVYNCIAGMLDRVGGNRIRAAAPGEDIEVSMLDASRLNWMEREMSITFLVAGGDGSPSSPVFIRRE